MSIDAKKDLVRRYFEDAPYHPEVCDEIFAPSVVWHAMYHTDQPEFVSTPEIEKDAYARHIDTWGDWCEFIDEMIAEGDRVMVRWTFRGIHQRSYLGIPPTKKQLTFSGIYIFRIDSGRIVEVWNLWDRVGEWQELGILPGTKEILDGAKGK